MGVSEEGWGLDLCGVVQTGAKREPRDSSLALGMTEEVKPVAGGGA